MPSGWHSCRSEKLKRAKGLEQKRRGKPAGLQNACDQEATRRRKRLSGQAVEKSLLTPASVGVLSEQEATMCHLEQG